MHRSLVIAIVLLTQVAAADSFHLRSGGRLEGQLLNAEEAPRTTYRIRLELGGEVTLDASEVARVVRPTPEQQRYQELLKKMPDTAEMHWKMAEDCLKWSLLRERQFHLEQIIRLDPDHEEARRILKYRRQKDGTWAKRSEIQARAGYVKHGGKWVTKHEAEIKTIAAQRRDAQLEWQKNLRMWRGWLNDRRDKRRREKALALIGAIDDPLAAEPLVKLFWSERDISLRELIAEVLGRLDSATAIRALAQAAMRGDTDRENDLRIYCIRQLEKNNRRGVVPSFIAELQSKDNANVRRAGYAIGVLGDESAVLPLIKAVRTKHTKYVGGLGNGGINAGRGGLSVGRTKPKPVDEIRNNKEVLGALVKLTGVDFINYDQRKWLDWYLSQTTPPRLDLRRDP